MNCSSSDDRRAICSCFRMYLWNFSIYVKDASSDNFVEANAQVADKEVLNPFDIHLHSHADSNALLHRASSYRTRPPLLEAVFQLWIPTG